MVLCRSIVLLATRGQPADISGAAQYLVPLGSAKTPDLQKKGKVFLQHLKKKITVKICFSLVRFTLGLLIPVMSLYRRHCFLWVSWSGRSFTTAMVLSVGLPRHQGAGITGKVHSPVPRGILLSTTKRPSRTDGSWTPEKIS